MDGSAVIVAQPYSCLLMRRIFVLLQAHTQNMKAENGIRLETVAI